MMHLSPQFASLSLALWQAGTSGKSNCQATPFGSSCNLADFLHVLYVVAAILAIALIVVVVFAIYVWRKGKRARIEDL